MHSVAPTPLLPLTHKTAPALAIIMNLVKRIEDSPKGREKVEVSNEAEP